MTLSITINCDNAAFADGDLACEITRILEKLALYDLSYVLNAGYIVLFDSNGNRVGEASFNQA